MIQIIAFGLIILLALWDWFTTMLGIVNLFSATGLIQYLFSGIAALALSFSLASTPAVFSQVLNNLANPINVFLIVSWGLAFIFNAITTLLGNYSSIKSGNPFNVRVDLGQLFEVTSLQDTTKLMIIVITTCIVIIATMIMAFAFNRD